MRILVISGSPRGIGKVPGHENITIDIPRPGGVVEPVPFDSCTERLADAFIGGARAAGADAVKLTLHELRNIAPCRACYGCLKGGKCVVQDDMQPVYREFDRADAVLFASPLYYATIPAQLLAVVNRLYPYWIDGMRYPKLMGAGVIGVCADLEQDWSLFDGLWRSIFREIGWPELGIVHAPRFMLDPAKHLAAAMAFGREFVSGCESAADEGRGMKG